ncbi:alcohol dehydrogenase-like [Prunus yedoensis var. nudiflora]|uniref:Alcohol dehydrogenase-like n=1 Tax=Prunus yedoensis var. nudiflora TaxID=2094558 RepID=A0A314XP02_PRUYE|nr:alcohol dehydrogenase-like [Prunus yedoensis var. nudiflora]
MGNQGCLAKINRLAPLNKVCILSCGISTGLGATLNVAKPKKGSSVAVFGLGAVGLAAAEGPRISGASRIIGIDRNPKRFEDGMGCGCACWSSEQGCSLHDYMTKPINVLNVRTLKGTFFGNYKPSTDLPSVVGMYMNKELEVEKFITHRVPFSEINKAFDYMVKGEGLRCIISMEE